VELPRGGEEAISVEDLQRDVFLLVDIERRFGSRGPASAGAAEATDRLAARMREMHTLPAFGRSWVQEAEGAGNVCGLKDGPQGPATLVIALDAGQGAALSASPVAMLISLAKAFDTPEKPSRTLVFCRVGPEGLDRLESRPPLPWTEVGDILVLSDMSSSKLLFEEIHVAGRSAVLARSGDARASGPEDDRMEHLDFRVLQQHARALHRELLNAPRRAPSP
jgi:hypothetical protein